MKMNKLVAAMAATAMSIGAHAALAPADSELTGTGSTSAAGVITEVSAIAIVVDQCTLEAFQQAQGMDAACVGNNVKLCAPTISSAELRGFLNGSWASATLLTGSEGTVASFMASCTTPVTKTALVDNRLTGDVVSAALWQFAGSTQVVEGGVACGPGSTVGSGTPHADNTALFVKLTTDDNKADIGFVHAVDLKSANETMGFLKLDGVAPDLVNLMSSNYNLVQNVYGTSTASVSYAYGMTTGTAEVYGTGIAHHKIAANGTENGCGPLTSDSSIDVNGGGL